MQLVVLGILILLAAGIAAWASRIQAVTLWAGKKIASPEVAQEAPRGFQDAITPKFQNNLNTISFILIGAAAIYGFIQAWYIGALSVLGVFLAQGLIVNLLPNRINPYLLFVIGRLDNRMADFKRDKDDMRAEASAFMTERLKDLYVEIRDKNLKIPPFSQIRKMPVGGDI